MVKNIKNNLDIIESLLYFWQASSEGEKVGESYIIDISNFDDMKYLFNDQFDKESIRKVLSAISNRELISDGTKTEMRFWNNNMWMMEDLEFTNMMVKPLKTLHSDKFVEDLNKISTKNDYENIEILFLPGHIDEYYIDGNKLIINFFKVTVDLFEEDKVTILGKDFDDYIEEKLVELMNK
ncbi:hypothetical protein [Miniphocaeibacter massiliensis]|uniref:TDE2712 family protein n=1 Tax=Miniphocaeibacter massiliensis TaxID=2041841 RepID=UPI000C1C548D|nr:hypothetical protein [Miniphocaeibacter massiliensis]